ncbi:hypothetical protein MAM1_0010c01127 [Mucor ambiguus]|uniref:Uncharacterized protein n=1 Tax=Mucor ambiguus TaxID=91626 RepID=A0A0C9MIE0_9FUNG|nr:hypothetical protein MAM1_0010c01127 [Mucor ambiguus]
MHNLNTKPLEDYEPTAIKRKFDEDFDEISGPHLALANDVKQDHLLSKALNCESFAKSIIGSTTIGEPTVVHGLIKKQRMDKLAEEIKFSNKFTSDVFRCVLHRERPQEKQSTTVTTNSGNYMLHNAITRSKLPRSAENVFVEASDDLITALNMDFRLDPDLLYAVAELHAGAIISDGFEALLLITAESYSRSRNIDIHSEKSMQSIPNGGSAISIGLCDEADSGPTRSKLKIGANSMNLLVTMSCAIAKCEVSVGPETRLSMDLKKATIFYDEQKLDNFMGILEDHMSYQAPMSISMLRQVTSGFNHVSTFHCWRSTLSGFDSDLLQPATVFTVVDTPSRNYDHSESSLTKQASAVLQQVALAILSKRSNDIDALLYQTKTTLEIKKNDMFQKLHDQVSVLASAPPSQQQHKPYCLQLSSYLTPIANTSCLSITRFIIHSSLFS